VLLRGLKGLVAMLAQAGGPGGDGPKNSDPVSDRESRLRLSMVAEQIAARGVRDPCILEAMRRVARHEFVPQHSREDAYRDGPLSIGHQQTISQPYIVALMTELIRPRPGMKVLEVGTGSGYQAAVLAACGVEVYTVEILPELSRRAAALLEALGYDDVHTRISDGSDGWPEEAPFEGILVTAAPAEIPPLLLGQLEVGGRLVIPVGLGSQDLVVATRTADGYERRFITPVRFVPMTGRVGQSE
jgi:protein-L-isoaspartate(D-aspartate) O-methyltransferase